MSITLLLLASCSRNPTFEVELAHSLQVRLGGGGGLGFSAQRIAIGKTTVRAGPVHGALRQRLPLGRGVVERTNGAVALGWHERDDGQQHCSDCRKKK